MASSRFSWRRPSRRHGATPYYPHDLSALQDGAESLTAIICTKSVFPKRTLRRAKNLAWPLVCEECRQLGSKAAKEIYELLLVTEALRPLIMNRAPAHHQSLPAPSKNGIARSDRRLEQGQGRGHDHRGSLRVTQIGGTHGSAESKARSHNLSRAHEKSNTLSDVGLLD